MRSIRIGVLRIAALLALLAIVGFPIAYADDPPNPFDPPDARIRPPGGIASDARIKPPGGDPSIGADIPPPVGSPQPTSRVKPPIGVTSEPSFFELMLRWLAARINPPIG